MTNEEIAAKGGEIAFNFKRSFANALTREMITRRVSNVQLSRRIGVAASSVQNWRSGKKLPSYEHMACVTAYFGYDSIFVFIGGEEIRNKIDEWVDSFKGGLLDEFEKRANAVDTDPTQQ